MFHCFTWNIPKLLCGGIDMGKSFFLGIFIGILTVLVTTGIISVTAALMGY